MYKLIKLEELKKYDLLHRREDVGNFKEIYFDDADWETRYLVIKTGFWLAGRSVLLHPMGIDGIDAEEHTIELSVTKEQLEACPPLSEAMPISRQYEEKYFRHFGWTPYWLVGPALPPSTLTPPPDEEAPKTDADIEASHLRSSAEVTGYRIETTEDGLGSVKDLIIENESWLIRYLEVATSNWWPARHILIAPSWVEEVSWVDKCFRIDLPEAALRSAPEYRPGRPIDRDYEIALYKHYGLPQYWQD